MPPFPSPSRTGGPGRRFGPLLLIGLILSGCDGSNLFATRPLPEPAPPAPDERAETLRYLEEALLLTGDESRLRFRWSGSAPTLGFDPGVPERERAAVRRAVSLVEAAGAPPAPEGAGAPSIQVEAFPPEAYRELDPTRPWSFSRTFVTATPETGITDVRILLSLELEGPVLERAALHAMGHAMGLMGHPAFPGDRYVMASSPEGAAPPTRFHPREEEALRFLYRPEIGTGMTRTQFRLAWAEANP